MYGLEVVATGLELGFLSELFGTTGGAFARLTLNDCLLCSCRCVVTVPAKYHNIGTLGAEVSTYKSCTRCQEYEVLVTQAGSGIITRTDFEYLCVAVDYNQMSKNSVVLKERKRLACMSTVRRRPDRIGIRLPLLPPDEPYPAGSNAEADEDLREAKDDMEDSRCDLMLECAKRGINVHTETDLTWCGYTSWLASVVHDNYGAIIPDGEGVRLMLEDICRQLIVWEREVVGKNFKEIPDGPFIMGEYSLSEDVRHLKYPLFVKDLMAFVLKWVEAMEWVRFVKGKERTDLTRVRMRIVEWANKEYDLDGEVRFDLDESLV